MIDPSTLDDLQRFMVLRDGWEDYDHPVVRRRNAEQLFQAAVRIARDLCGEGVLREVYGASDDVDGAERLKLLARRVEAASLLFLPFHDEPNNLSSITDEAIAVANGDRPVIFAQLGKLTKARLLGAKLEALRWEAWLGGLGEPTSARQHAITTAYLRNGQWDSIRRGWKRDAEGHFGKGRITSVLMRERQAGAANLPRWSMRIGETWQHALERSGKRFQRLS